jgi:hypothetical protein
VVPSFQCLREMFKPGGSSFDRELRVSLPFPRLRFVVSFARLLDENLIDVNRVFLRLLYPTTRVEHDVGFSITSFASHGDDHEERKLMNG